LILIGKVPFQGPAETLCERHSWLPPQQSGRQLSISNPIQWSGRSFRNRLDLCIVPSQTNHFPRTVNHPREHRMTDRISFPGWLQEPFFELTSLRTMLVLRDMSNWWLVC
jgi:hypothetical protein